jgi:hypothetical protein
MEDLSSQVIAAAVASSGAVEVFLRCEIPDVPGGLATLAGAIGEAGGDIQAVEVVEAADGRATDDLWLETLDTRALRARVEAIADASVVHLGPSRGLPGDATGRLATGIDLLLSGAMDPADALPTLVGGLLRADRAVIEPHHDWPAQRDRTVLRLAVAGGVLVVHREYRFLDPEVQRARHVLAVCERAAAIGHLGG